MKPSPDRIRALLEYDPATGLFRWKSPTVRQAKGWFKGNKSVRNYRQLYIDGHHYLAHVIAFVIVDGSWPQMEIGHRDRDHANNKWGNLRHREKEVRGFNRRINRNNTTGHRGVSRFEEDRFRAVIHYRKQHISLGLFDDPDAAGAAWLEAARRYYKDEYHE